jgi:hypothetical protein
VVGSLETPGGAVDRITARFDWLDRLSWWRVRWGIGRMGMAVRPGLYALNAPTCESEVFVTANYKMSLDHVRRSLGERDAWILVLDTEGINVWCAAGKGTFCTETLAEQIIDVGLARVVTHSRLILPQLGAVGVDAGAVSAQTGFRVRYGPVRAADIPAYLDAGREASAAMRRVTFGVVERAVLVPIEIINAGKFLIPAMAVLFILSGFFRDGFSVDRMLGQGFASVAALMAAWLGGSVLGPLLLPLLPGRMLSVKGAVAAGVALLAAQMAGALTGSGILDVIAFWLAAPAIASFVMMNFTGATPYTSPSGVRREMKLSVPVQAVAVAAAVILWVVQRFVGA